MKKVLPLLLLAAIITNATNAQFGGNLLKKVKAKVNQRVDNKTDQAIDKKLDQAEGKQPIGDKNANSGTDVKASADAKGNAVEPTGTITSFTKYDFVPGEKVIYANSFETDNAGELPTGWNCSGNSAVVTLNSQKGNWLQLHQNAVTLTDNKQSFTENCTIEFDLLFSEKANGYILPMIAFGLLNSGDAETTDNKLLQNYKETYAIELKLQPGVQHDSHFHLETFAANTRYLNTDIKSARDLEPLYNSAPIHVAMQVQKERLRIWTNGEKLYDLPKAITEGTILNQLYFSVKASNYSDEQVGYYVSNIKIAKGLPDTRHKLIEEGKFSTTGILFDINAATIKPESAGVLKEIASALTQYKDVKIKITGHTDSDGSDVANLTLSQKRAAAVKDALVADYSIDAARIETDGKGESAPVADNKSKEGKAANRRVEFVKL